jgi:hypothetical protein
LYSTGHRKGKKKLMQNLDKAKGDNFSVTQFSKSGEVNVLCGINDEVNVLYGIIGEAIVLCGISTDGTVQCGIAGEVTVL